ncbi:tautomerase family protein [Streptomyces bohaiensis]|uniref:4-oxalocrotonate tautomerase-like domain-containing protein n=1 Tax=Streptomyces bohaiensis TaxID=1431344 RepID=A0ABX1CB68_9ACTN|nr:tautomerase family protein [Streptomyces bohaiensis]NJQ14875.1 hypothetical protein [Streptomyces bohaiensis]
MPVITVEWWQGNDRDRRSHLVSELAAATSRVTGCAPDEVTVIVRDCEPGPAPDPRGSADQGEVGLSHGSPW